MSKSQLSFTGTQLTVDSNTIELDYGIADAFVDGDKVIVLFDPDAVTQKLGQFRNLVAINFSGSILWRAEVPATSNGERYYRISSRVPLIAESIFSHSCAIDSNTGRIVADTFCK